MARVGESLAPYLFTPYTLPGCYAPTQKGLHNSGDDCFANASFQCLSSIRLLMETIRTDRFLSTSPIHRQFYNYASDLQKQQLPGSVLRENLVALMPDSHNKQYLITEFGCTPDNCIIRQDNARGTQFINAKISDIKNRGYSDLNPPDLAQLPQPEHQQPDNLNSMHFFTRYEKNKDDLRTGQHDAHEYLSAALDILTDSTDPHFQAAEMANARASMDSLISQFRSQMSETVTRQCPNRHTRVHFEPPSTMLQLNLLLQKEELLVAAEGTSFEDIMNKGIRLKALLDEKFKQEDLGEIPCNECKDGIDYQSVKTHKITHWPRILIIQLVRFTATGKNKRPVQIPLLFSLKEYLTEGLQRELGVRNVNYNLRGVICHGGETGGGHYWAYVKRDVREYNETTRRECFKSHWYCYNDGSTGDICNIIEDLLCEQFPYVLFYELDARSPLSTTPLILEKTGRTGEVTSRQELPPAKKFDWEKDRLHGYTSEFLDRANRTFTSTIDEFKRAQEDAAPCVIPGRGKITPLQKFEVSTGEESFFVTTMYALYSMPEFKKKLLSTQESKLSSLQKIISRIDDESGTTIHVSQQIGTFITTAKTKTAEGFVKFLGTKQLSHILNFVELQPTDAVEATLAGLPAESTSCVIGFAGTENPAGEKFPISSADGTFSLKSVILRYNVQESEDEPAQARYEILWDTGKQWEHVCLLGEKGYTPSGKDGLLEFMATGNTLDIEEGVSLYPVLLFYERKNLLKDALVLLKKKLLSLSQTLTTKPKKKK
jgi:hypothetical protein